MSRGSENPTKRKRVGGMREKGNEARATWSICAKTTLCAKARASLRHRPGKFGLIPSQHWLKVSRVRSR